MAKSLLAVDEDDWNLCGVALFQFGVAFDVDLFEYETVGKSFAKDDALCLVAEVAAGLRVDDDMRSIAQFEFRFLSSTRQQNVK